MHIATLFLARIVPLKLKANHPSVYIWMQQAERGERRALRLLHKVQRKHPR